MTGGSIAALNQVHGHQHGVTIGIWNYARTIKGFQLGIINVVGNNPTWARVLPFFNTNFN